MSMERKEIQTLRNFFIDEDNKPRKFIHSIPNKGNSLYCVDPYYFASKFSDELAILQNKDFIERSPRMVTRIVEGNPYGSSKHGVYLVNARKLGEYLYDNEIIDNPRDLSQFIDTSRSFIRES